MRTFIQLFILLNIAFTAVSADEITKRGKHTVSCVTFSLAAVKVKNTWIEAGRSGYNVCRIIHVKN